MGLGVKGFIPVSMLDWDGNLAATLFTAGCNFRCPYCHNPELTNNKSTLQDIDFALIEQHLENKRNWLDGVVVTGGEPLVNPQVEQLLIRLKDLGYQVKLDTNGALPGALEKLFEKHLVDYVAMDVKTSLAKYAKVTKSDSGQDILKSIQLLIGSGIPHEFRTTVVPGFVTADDVLEIANIIKEGEAFFLQQFSSQQVLEPQVRNLAKYDDGLLLDLAKRCAAVIPTKVRGIEQRAKMAV